jgi:hypothetical protein
MPVLGPIVRLQIQQSSLKTGTKPFRQYDPAPVLAVPSLVITTGGAMIRDPAQGIRLDVHHRDHSAGKHADGINGLSVLFTSHYRAMRARFGAHVADGVAGESILVDTEHSISEDDLRGGLLITTADGATAHLHITQVAEPCVEFTRFNLRLPPDARADQAFKDAMQFLRDGRRGFYAAYRGEPITLRLGDRVSLP